MGRQRWAGWGRALACVLLAAVLSLTMTACSGAAAPSRGVIQQGVVRQFEQLQQELQQQLGMASPGLAGVQIAGVEVKRTERLVLQDLPAYRLQGSYTLKGKSLSRSQRQARNPFEIYLQSQDGGQSWVLLKPAVTSADLAEDNDRFPDLETTSWLRLPLP